jgi:hypothetical protein
MKAGILKFRIPAVVVLHLVCCFACRSWSGSSSEPRVVILGQPHRKDVELLIAREHRVERGQVQGRDQTVGNGARERVAIGRLMQLRRSLG